MASNVHPDDDSFPPVHSFQRRGVPTNSMTRTWLWIVLCIGVGSVMLLGTVSSVQAATEVCGDISNDVVWSAAKGPYLVTCNTTVKEGATLVIEPGTQIRFLKATHRTKIGLRIEGELNADGTGDQPILFTSDEPKPHPQDWGGITFAPSSTGSRFDKNGTYTGGASLQYCVIEYGGAVPWQGAVEVLGTSLYLNNVLIHMNAASGIRAKDGKVHLQHSTLTKNSNSLAGSGGGLIARASEITIEDSFLHDTVSSGSGGAIYVTQSVLTLRGTKFINNETAGNGGAVFVSASTLNITDATFHKNESPVRGGAVYIGNKSTASIDRSTFINNRTLPTAALGEGEGKSTKHTLGAAVFSDKSTLTVAGTLFTDNKSVTECGALAVRSSVLNLSTSVFLDNTAVYNGAALCIEDGKGGSSITQNTFTRNVSDKYLTPNTIYLESGAFPTFTDNNIYGNSGFDIVNDTPDAIHTSGNWWGTTDEFAIEDRVLGHVGELTKGEITFTPFLQHKVVIPNPADSKK